jgi:hypothetical protein
MKEDWKETGRAIRDRSSEIARESVNAGKDAIKAAASTVREGRDQSSADPAKNVPPESVNEYTAKDSLADMTDSVRRAGKKAMDVVKKAYERVEGMGGGNEGSAEMPSDSLHHKDMRDEAEQLGIKDYVTKRAFKKGQELQEEREPMKGN